MSEKMKKFFVAFLPENLTPKAIAILTVRRQKMLISLLKEEQTLSRLARELGLAVSSIFEAMDEFKKLGIVEKNLNKVYALTKKGKLLALTLLIPNGFDFSVRDSFLNKILEKEFGIDDEEYRDELIENCHVIETLMEEIAKPKEV